MGQLLGKALEAKDWDGLQDVVPFQQGVALYFREPLSPRREAELEALVETLLPVVRAADGSLEGGRTVEVPVWYGGEAGCDLEEVARRLGLSMDEVVSLHSQAEYGVEAIGFAPGFPYLSGLPERLHLPRRDTPRTRIPAGSVGIGGAQTGVYPLETPGGWNLIGRTPLRLFDPGRAEPSLLRVGDRVRFVPLEAGGAAWRVHAGGYDEGKGGLGGPGAEELEQAEHAVLEVLRPGMFTTVQDLGRPGYRAGGMTLGGAVDRFSLEVANRMVGNDPDAAALEFTLVGPDLLFLRDTVVALAGGSLAGWPAGQPVRVRKGQTLRLGVLERGCRGYLAVAGGFGVPRVLGSRSTAVRAGFGGYRGRPLRAGDRLPLGRLGWRCAGPVCWRLEERLIFPSASPVVVRVLRGTHAHEFAPEALAVEFRVGAQSDRMGVRLEGVRVGRMGGAELRSMPVSPGVVQVPPDGHPIVLLADAQTLGGYPQLAHVVSADLPRMAQVRPGETVRFEEVTLGQARELARQRRRELGLVRLGLEAAGVEFLGKEGGE
jgi:KipI family sensor histidine kinase inhibitor